MTSPSIEEKQSEIVELFSMLDDWQDRYRMIIEIGRELVPMPAERRSDIHKIKGCQSQVWLRATLNEGRLTYEADSDAAIVKGLVALMVKVYSGHTPQEILNSPARFVDTIGLSKHLSQSRANGLSSMIKKVMLHAQVHQEALQHQQGDSQ